MGKISVEIFKINTFLKRIEGTQTDLHVFFMNPTSGQIFEIVLNFYWRWLYNIDKNKYLNRSKMSSFSFFPFNPWIPL